MFPSHNSCRTTMETDPAANLDWVFSTMFSYLSRRIDFIEKGNGSFKTDPLPDLTN